MRGVGSLVLVTLKLVFPDVTKVAMLGKEPDGTRSTELYPFLLHKPPTHCPTWKQQLDYLCTTHTGETQRKHTLVTCLGADRLGVGSQSSRTGWEELTASSEDLLIILSHLVNDSAVWVCGSQAGPTLQLNSTITCFY